MKCVYIIILLSIGLQSFNADDEITETAEVTTELSITSEKNEIENTSNSGKNYDETPNDLEARLPSDSQSIRSNIIDTNFSCKDHEPGYYADVENECQIFHRCLQGQDRVFSFICPEQTAFSQRALVCVWSTSRDFDCAGSEDYYEESNRAFSGNKTAETTINENMKNSTEITDMEEIDGIESDEMKTNLMSEDIKLLETLENQKLETIGEKSEMVEKNSIEEILETTSSFEQETEESNEYQAELIPSSLHGIDASIASVSDSISSSHPQKISISILDPIIEMPSQDALLSIEMPSQDLNQLQNSEATRNFRKRSGTHNSRFLFKADAH